MVSGHYFGAVGERNSVTADATVTPQHASAKVELRCSRQLILVALTAAGLDIACRQDWLLAGSLAGVRLGDRGSRTLPTVANHATESVQ